MIKYPVRVREGFNSLTGQYTVEDSTGMDFSICDTEEQAILVANALNAMH